MADARSSLMHGVLRHHASGESKSLADQSVARLVGRLACPPEPAGVSKRVFFEEQSRSSHFKRNSRLPIRLVAAAGQCYATRGEEAILRVW